MGTTVTEGLIEAFGDGVGGVGVIVAVMAIKGLAEVSGKEGEVWIEGLGAFVCINSPQAYSAGAIIANIASKIKSFFITNESICQKPKFKPNIQNIPAINPLQWT